MITVLVVGFMIYALLPYLNAFVGALVLFVLLYPINKFLNKKLRKEVSASICIILSLLIIVAPIIFLSNSLIVEVSDIVKEKKLDNLVNDAKGFLGDKAVSEKQISEISLNIKPILTKIANSFFRSATHFFISLAILYAALFFMLINDDNFIKAIQNHLPFNETNSRILMNEFVNITKSTVLGMGLVAIIQGILLGICLYLLKIKGAVFLGFLGAIFSFLPIVGIPFIWIPIALYYLLTGQYFVAIVLILWCLIIVTGSDYVLRIYLFHKIAKLHPLVTLLGVFIGVPYFGVMGILIGPLLISYLFLLIKMYGEEYLG